MDKVLSVLRTNPYISSSVSLFLALYAGLAAPALPANIAGLFEYGVFKLLILVLVLVLLKGQNITMALLVSIGFVISMGTLSRYRVFTMANELASFSPSASTTSAKSDAAFGPDGQRVQVPGDAASWSSKDGVNRLNIRGYEYAGHDEKNHLPGGHDSDPEGYSGHNFATIGAPDSQL